MARFDALRRSLMLPAASLLQNKFISINLFPYNVISSQAAYWISILYWIPKGQPAGRLYWIP